MSWCGYEVCSGKNDSTPYGTSWSPRRIRHDGVFQTESRATLNPLWNRFGFSQSKSNFGTLFRKSVNSRATRCGVGTVIAYRSW